MSIVQLMDQRTVAFECDVSVAGSSQPHVVVTALNDLDKGAMLRLTVGEAVAVAEAMIREAGAVTERERLEAMYDLPSAEER